MERWRKYSERLDNGVPPMFAGLPIPSYDALRTGCGLAVVAACLIGAAYLLWGP
jgi:hypothetical protein